MMDSGEPPRKIPRRDNAGSPVSEKISSRQLGERETRCLCTGSPERANIPWSISRLLGRRRKSEQKDCGLADRGSARNHNLAAGFPPAAVVLRPLRARSNEGSHQGGDHARNPQQGPGEERPGEERPGEERPRAERPGEEGDNRLVAGGPGL